MNVVGTAMLPPKKLGKQVSIGVLAHFLDFTYEASGNYFGEDYLEKAQSCLW